MEVEIWRPIKIITGYEISNLGNVRSIDRPVINSRSGRPFIKAGKILSSSNNRGYAIINILNNSYKIHRLVAEAFLPNCNNLPCVNHINGVRNDNRVDNLEWISYSDNNKHSFRVLNRVHPMLNKKGALHACSKKVRCSTLDIIFNSVTEAAHALNCDASTIIKVCKGSELYTKGLYFTWA